MPTHAGAGHRDATDHAADRAASRPARRQLPQGTIDGAYWLREPGPNCDIVLAYQGCVAIEAAGRLGEFRRDIGVLAVTSADRLNAGWTAAQRARRRGNKQARSHIERLLAPLPSHTTIITVIDGHPATLAWLGAVGGHKAVPLGVEHFGQPVASHPSEFLLCCVEPINFTGAEPD